MDSMDQQKVACPHFWRLPKNLDSNAVVPLHVTALRIPGHGVIEFTYVNNLPHDANTTITCLHRCVLASVPGVDGLRGWTMQCGGHTLPCSRACNCVDDNQTPAVSH